MKTLKTVLPAAFNQIRQGATFLSVKDYWDNFNGKSHFGIVFHVNYINAVKKSVNTWYQYKPLDYLEKEVKNELLDSYADTLQGYNSRALSAFAYCGITDGVKPIKSVKWHENGKAVHLWGFLVHKVKLVEPVYPDDYRLPKTIVRKKFMRMTPLNRFRQFKLVDGRFGSIGVEHLTLTQQDLLKI